MAKETKNSAPKYSDIVERLEQVVVELEGGELSLEASLDKFAEGVKLIESGEELLRSAERRIEVLLSKEGDTVPFEEGSVANSKVGIRGAKKESGFQKPNEDDVPF